ncbi:MAG TPA: hypothetical protein VLS49_00510 [Usitatibacter sp.]|nr:hypothetical protein [Usitatibacter sp.]
MTPRNRRTGFAWTAACLAIVALPAFALQGSDEVDGNKARNLRLVGWNDLQARSAYQVTVHKQGGRYIAYVGHHALGTNPLTGQPLPSYNPLTQQDEPNGTSLVDVTDPKKPVYLAHIPVGTTGNGGAQMVRVCDGSSLPIHDSKVYMLRNYGTSAHEVWDTSDPAHPQPVRTVEGGNPIVGNLVGTHKNWWECDTGIAWLVGRRATDTADGWAPGNHVMVYDMSDPANPVFLRDWALDGQQPGGVLPPHFTSVPAIHGPISTGPSGNRVYFAYGTSSNGVMQIADRSLILSTPANDFTTAETGRWVMNPLNGAHTSFPLGPIDIADQVANKNHVRDFVVVTSEETSNQCTGSRHLTYFVDATNEARSMSSASYQLLESSGHFCDRGGRFGPHATNENFGPPYYKKVVFISYFNAGVRAVDVRNPEVPTEIGFYVPDLNANTDYRCATIDGQPVCKRAIQTNNVDTDDRGYVYIVDRADSGMHILAPTGQLRTLIGQ